MAGPYLKSCDDHVTTIWKPYNPGAARQTPGSRGEYPMTKLDQCLDDALSAGAAAET